MSRPDLPSPLRADRFDLRTPAGRVCVYHAGPDATRAPGMPASHPPPLLLVHSVNAAASAAEVAPLFEHYRRTRPVFALDLPGYGLSARDDRDYTPRTMTDAVLAVIAAMRARHAGVAVDMLAVSLACEFAARARGEAPDAIRRLALVSPTGFSGTRPRAGPPGSTLALPWLHRVLTVPLWSEGIFRGLTRPGVIRYFLQRTWGAKTIDEELWRYDLLTTRQPGARHAPLCFLSAGLFSKDIDHVYRALDCPVWVSMATRGDFTDYRRRDHLRDRPNWQFHVVEGGALPYFEPGSAFVTLLERFWAAP